MRECEEPRTRTREGDRARGQRVKCDTVLTRPEKVLADPTPEAVI